MGLSDEECRAAMTCRRVARHQRQCAANVVRQHARSNERRCRAALAAWAEQVQHSRAVRSRLCAAVHRLALLRLSAALCAWARLAEAKRLQRARHSELVQQVWISTSLEYCHIPV